MPAYNCLSVPCSPGIGTHRYLNLLIPDSEQEVLVPRHQEV